MNIAEALTPEEQADRKIPSKVRRRAVFYIPGYDPLSPRRYRELYRTQAQKQAEILGYDISIRGLPGRPEGYAWEATWQKGPRKSEALIEFLAWNDIVKGTLRRPIIAIYGLMVLTLWRFLAHGALIPMIRLRPGPMLAGLFPVLFMLGYLLIAGLAGEMVWIGLTAIGLPWPAALFAAIAVFLGLMHLTRRLERIFFVYYLVCDFAYVAKALGATPPELQARMDHFAARVRAALDADYDEVLVVGHSSGAHLAVSVVAHVLRQREAKPGPVFSLLTLGQAIPMASFLPKAQALRRDLYELSRSDRLAWIDVSAMGDGASFSLCDPVAVTGVASESKRWPKVISAAFRQTLSKERLRYLRLRYFLRHIQYLCAFDYPKDYDYFQITAGPRTLQDRFEKRRPSPSREERVFSRHRDF